MIDPLSDVVYELARDHDDGVHGLTDASTHAHRKSHHFCGCVRTIHLAAMSSESRRRASQ